MLKYPPLFALLLVSLSTTTAADVLGTIVLEDGRRFDMTRIGPPEKAIDYYVKINHRFVPLNRIRQLALVGVGLNGDMGYRFLLTDGRLLKSGLSDLFYHKVRFRNPGTGEIKIAFVPVLKGRNNDGFIFESIDTRTNTTVLTEITNPNDIVELHLWNPGQLIQQPLLSRQ